MVLGVAEPYFNEPGFERAEGTPSGRAASAGYNRGLRAATLRHAVLPALARPLAGFEEPLRAHYLARAEEVKATARAWAAEAAAGAAAAPARGGGGGAKNPRAALAAAMVAGFTSADIAQLTAHGGGGAAEAVAAVAGDGGVGAAAAEVVAAVDRLLAEERARERA
jgi:hypothetical protein